MNWAPEAVTFLKIVGIDLIIFYITYKLWLRAEDFENIGEEPDKVEAFFVALVNAVAVICAYYLV